MKILALLVLCVSAQAAGPTISAFTLVVASQSELLGSWTTNVTADSQLECGTTTGVYTLTSEVVNPLTTTLGATGYSVTDHSITIAGLQPSTLYFCKPISVSAGGSTTGSTELSATTNASVTPPSSRRIILSSSFTRYNDQFPINGRQSFGDSSYCTWAGDGNTYCSYQDCHLPNTATGANTIVFNWPTSTDLTYSVNSLTNALSSVTTAWRTFGVFSIYDRSSNTSMLYDSLFSNSTNGDTSFLKSYDFGVHWITPQNNTGPGTVGGTTGQLPTTGACMICGATFAARATPFQHCQDHNACSGMSGNGRSYQYFYTNDFGVGLARMRVEDAATQDGTKITYYTGTFGDEAAGYLPANWSSTRASGTTTATSVYHFWPSAAWLDGFNKWLVISWTEMSSGDVTPVAPGLNLYTIDTPWSVPVLIGNIAMPGTPSGFLPAFPNLQLATYSKQSAHPLSATIKLLVSGYFTGQTNDPTTNQYSLFTYNIQLTEAPSVTLNGKVSLNGKVAIR